jgi:hypothetical protein
VESRPSSFGARVRGSIWSEAVRARSEVDSGSHNQDEEWDDDDPLGDGVGEFDYLSCEWAGRAAVICGGTMFGRVGHCAGVPS